MQIPQFERKHDAEKSDDEESKGNHVDHVQCTYCRLPQYDESTDDGEDTEGHIPAPVAGAIGKLGFKKVAILHDSTSR